MKSRTMRERLLAFLLTLAVLISGCVIQPLGEKAYAADTQTALQVHGQLAVNGTQIVDRNGQAFQLRGVSTHGINWDVGKPYVNQAAFRRSGMNGEQMQSVWPCILRSTTDIVPAETRQN